MIDRRALEEWPLAAFTLLLQVACGIVIATTLAEATHLPIRSAVLLGTSVFPIIAAGLMLSLLHLGQPLSACRALSNLRSRLSQEILFASSFAAVALGYSFACWADFPVLRLCAGPAASVVGTITVMASANIYRVPARPIWNSGWVLTSFVGSTFLVAGFALSPTDIGALLVAIGSMLLLGAGLWMRSICCARYRLMPLRIWFASHLLLVVAAPVVALFGRRFLPSVAVSLAFALAIAGIIAGRMLMFAVAELEPRF